MPFCIWHTFSMYIHAFLFLFSFACDLLLHHTITCGLVEVNVIPGNGIFIDSYNLRLYYIDDDNVDIWDVKWFNYLFGFIWSFEKNVHLILLHFYKCYFKLVKVYLRYRLDKNISTDSQLFCHKVQVNILWMNETSWRGWEWYHLLIKRNLLSDFIRLISKFLVILVKEWFTYFFSMESNKLFLIFERLKLG